MRKDSKFQQGKPKGFLRRLQPILNDQEIERLFMSCRFANKPQLILFTY